MLVSCSLYTAAKPPIVVTATSAGLVVAIVIAVVVVLIILALAGYLPYRSVTLPTGNVQDCHTLSRNLLNTCTSTLASSPGSPLYVRVNIASDDLRTP